MANIENIVRKIANRFGIDIKRYKDEASESAKIAKMLNSNKIELVIDIGANSGQYAKLLRTHGYSGRIISFEPLQDAWNQLQRASKNDSLWEIYPRCAIGDYNSSKMINVSGNSVSSSLLKMLDQHCNSAPESAYIGQECVDVITLDYVFESIDYKEDARIFIKIDTQGYEEKVLNGAIKSISSITGIQIELSIVPLYETQELIQPMLDRLTKYGFSIWSILPGFTDQNSGRMLQCDAILFKAPSINHHA